MHCSNFSNGTIASTVKNKVNVVEGGRGWGAVGGSYRQLHVMVEFVFCAELWHNLYIR